MGAFKQLLASDIIVTPFGVNKSFIFQGSSTLTESNVGIDRLLGRNFLQTSSKFEGAIYGLSTYGDPFSTYAGSDIPTGEIDPIDFQSLVYYSVRHLYYSNYLSSSYGDAIPTASIILGALPESNVITGSFEGPRYDNYLQTTLSYPRYFPTSSKFDNEENIGVGVISIPTMLYGDYIKPGSFYFSTESGSLIDDGEGNLIENNTYISASGGTEIIDGEYKIHIFSTSGTSSFTIHQINNNKSNSIEYFIVGGGGGGSVGISGTKYGSGGGGGTVISGSYTISKQSYDVIVGGGGSGSTLINTNANSGLASSIFNITASGGYGAFSGSGGGNLNFLGAVPVSGMINLNSAGGAGAGGIGGGGYSYGIYNQEIIPGTGSNGGIGITSSISGQTLGYGGGGGGWRQWYSPFQSTGSFDIIDEPGSVQDGGGTASIYSNGGNGVRGGGGGGAAGGYYGGNGGDGIVIIKYRQYSASQAQVGQIFYPHGIAVITGNSQGEYFNNILNFVTSSNVTCSFSSSYTIYETQYKCTIGENEFNFTLNPTISSGSTATTSSVGTFYTPGENLIGFATASYFNPYITTVGLYDDQQNLLAVGKLAQPLPSSPTTDTTIIINIDR